MERYEDVAESYSWNGKHYYYQHRITTSFALNYSKKTIEENDLPDPYELYRNGEWTWDAWRDIMIQFCDKDDDNIGFYATDTTVDAFILTTGTSIVDTQPSGVISNNIANPNVTRAMQFIETLCRDGVSYGKQLATGFLRRPSQLSATACCSSAWSLSGPTSQLQSSSRTRRA